MQRVERWFVMIVLTGMVAGCVAGRPGYYAYPQRGQTAEQSNRDQYECQTWARQQSRYDPGAATVRGAGTGGILGALGGAAAGAAIGAATGSPGRGAAIGAATGGVGGAVLGGSSAYAQSKEGFDRAYAACMAGRGYTVR